MKTLLLAVLMFGFSNHADAEVSQGRLSVGLQIVKAFGDATISGYAAVCLSEDGYEVAQINTHNVESLSWTLRNGDPRASTQDITMSSERVAISKWAVIKEVRSISKATADDVSCAGKRNTGAFSVVGSRGSEPVVFNCTVTLKAYDCGGLGD